MIQCLVTEPVCTPALTGAQARAALINHPCFSDDRVALLRSHIDGRDTSVLAINLNQMLDCISMQCSGLGIYEWLVGLHCASHHLAVY
jgi:hypothetical protein